jgi:hypothetical protein
VPTDLAVAGRRLASRVGKALQASPLLPVAYRHTPPVVLRAILFYRFHNRVPRVRRPSTFAEKVNWRVLFDRRDVLAWTCDKLQMKEQARRRDPRIAVPRTIWHGTDLAELAALPLPERWVLKANHASQRVHLGSGRPTVAELERITSGWLEPSFQEASYREWAYQKAARVLVVEEWIGDDDGTAPADLKFFCFDGRVAMVAVHLSRFSDHTVAFYDPSWRKLSVTVPGNPPVPDVPEPENLADLLDHATRLSAGFDFIRVDLYNTPRGVYLGEFTPYPASGWVVFEPATFDRTLGELWTLPVAGRNDGRADGRGGRQLPVRSRRFGLP